jgi:Peptidase A4 family
MHLFNHFSSALFATTVLANPFDRGIAQRGVQTPTPLPTASNRTSWPVHLAPGTSRIVKNLANEAVTNVNLSANWAGAVIGAPPVNDSFNYVQGQFVVPKPTGAAGGAAIWIGIDGVNTRNAILQIGVDINIDSKGVPNYQSWFQWFPETCQYLIPTQFPFSAGDDMFLAVQAFNSTAANVTIYNVSLGNIASFNVSSSKYPLLGLNAEWVVEDYDAGGEMVPLVNFGNVTFYNSFTGTVAGANMGPQQGDILEMADYNRKVLTQVTTPQITQVDIIYAA